MQHSQSRHLGKSSVVVVTGASSDIGYVLTKRLADLGISVMAHYSSNATQLEKLPGSLVQLHKADLRHDSSAAHLVNAAIERFGRIDALINVIGPYQQYDLVAMTPSAWRDTVDLNLNIAFSMAHYASPQLIKHSGQILNFTYAGVENLSAWLDSTAYAAAKAGLGVLTKSLAQALAPHSVRANAISPGWIDFGKFTKEKMLQIQGQVPMQRLGAPEEVVDLAEWILTKSPAYLTGALISIAGGLEF